MIYRNGEAALLVRSRGPKEVLLPRWGESSIEDAIAQQRYQLTRFREELSSGLALQLEALYPGHCAGRMLACGLAAVNEQRCRMRSQGAFEALAAPGAVMIMAGEQRFSRLTANNNKHPTLDDARAVLESDGHHPVLLYIRARTKFPYWEGWRKIDYAKSQEADYQQKLRAHPNVGVALGSVSGNLCTIDCDTDAALEAILALNPRIQASFRTRGQSGGQIWLYIPDPRPHKFCALFVDERSPLAIGARNRPENGRIEIGEFRAEGGQSVVCGIHPEAMHYRWPVASPPVEIAFDRIIWPIDIIIPWEPERKKSSDIADDSLLKRAISKLSVDYLWTHFGYPDRGNRNPVRSPWHPDDVDTSFSIYDERRRFKDHDPGRPDERGDSFNFYCLARGVSASDAFRPFVELAGLGDELREKTQTKLSDLPEIRLPADNQYISEFAILLSAILRPHEVFRRFDKCVAPKEDEQNCVRLGELSAQEFRTLIENYCTPWKWRKIGKEKTEKVRRSLSIDDARATLVNRELLTRLRAIRDFNQISLPRSASLTIRLLPKGYDEETQSYTVRNALDYPQDTSLEEAREFFDELLDEFPFIPSDKERSKSVVLAAGLTLYAKHLLKRPAIRPNFLVSANSEGAGKTLLWKIPIIALQGRAPAGTTPEDEDEMRKLIGAAALSGSPVLLLDNVKGHLSSASLEALTTSPVTQF
jgi:hypothetical protein